MGARRLQRAARGEHGQVAIGLVASIPILILLALAMIQFVLARHAVLTAANAARAAARADYAGGEPERAARLVLPPSFRDHAELDAGPRRVAVEIEAPRALPFGPRVPVRAAALLGPADGAPGG
jgi:hypothetical protein